MTTRRELARQSSSSIQTVGVTTTTVLEMPLVDGCSYHITASVVGRATDGSTITANRFAGAKRVSGTASLVDVVVSLITATDLSLSGSVITMDVDDTAKTIRVRVTGVALTTIDWWGKISALEWSP